MADELFLNLITTRISRRCKSHSGHGRSSDSSRSSCLPGITPVAKVRCSFFVDSQQRVLSRIFTGFPFHSEGVNLPKPFSGCKVIYITCHIQTIHIIFTIKHTKHDNRVALIRAFKFTTNEDGNYHTQYP